MNKLNTRQWLVAGLSLGAVFMVYENVVKPIFHGPVQETVQSVGAPDDSIGASLISDSRQRLSSEPLLGAARVVNKASLNHIFQGQRDPFTLTKNNIAPSQKFTKKPRIRVNKVTIENRPELTAVMFGPVQKYALVDGEIVSEGESVNGVRVVKIAKDNVIFEGYDGEFTLKLTTAQIGKIYE